LFLVFYFFATIVSVALSQDLPNLPDSFSSPIWYIQTQGSHSTNNSGWMFQDFENKRSRQDILAGIVFETLMRFDLNESYNIAEGHCYTHIIFFPMMSFWFWIDQSFQGHECHADFILKSGITYNWISPQGDYFTVCVAHDNVTPYWFERTTGGNHDIFQRTFFTEFNATTPDANYFEVPNSCSDSWVS